MTKRDKIMQAAANIEGSAVLLPERWNDALIGYTIKENTVIGVYDYNRAVQLPPGIDLDDCLVLEDALLDDLRAIENLVGKEFKPVLVLEIWHNTSACTKSPKKDCKAREPRKIEPNKPHKLIDDFNKMKSCPYHEDWHYCCRCKFEYICKWSDNKIKEVQEKYIKENWGK